MHMEESSLVQGSGKGTGYTVDSQRTEDPSADENSPTPITAAGSMDNDNVATPYNVRKLRALTRVKSGGSLLKVGTGSEPVCWSCYTNPFCKRAGQST